MPYTISIYYSQDINPDKWNNCVAKNSNGLIYAQYQYLNHLCTNWSAIIVGDYDAVMPFPWNTKWGIKYFQAIPFIQQLGLIGSIEIQQFPKIWELIHEFASYGDLFLNFNNQEFASSVLASTKANFVLNLKQDYGQIQKGYKKDLRNNLEKAKKHGQTYCPSFNIAFVLEQYQLHYAKRLQHVSNSFYQKLSLLLHHFQSNDQCLIREMHDPTSKELLSIALLIKDEKRIYLLINVITQKGRKMSSNHTLIDHIIQEFLGKDLLFDFEGSQIPGVRDFFEHFNPQMQPYFQVHHNQLIWPLKLFKK